MYGKNLDIKMTLSLKFTQVIATSPVSMTKESFYQQCSASKTRNRVYKG